jgi:hypothetical protein
MDRTAPSRNPPSSPKTALWLATTLVLLALTIDWWAPLFY